MGLTRKSHVWQSSVFETREKKLYKHDDDELLLTLTQQFDKAKVQ